MVVIIIILIILMMIKIVTVDMTVSLIILKEFAVGTQKEDAVQKDAVHNLIICRFYHINFII